MRWVASCLAGTLVFGGCATAPHATVIAAEPAPPPPDPAIEASTRAFELGKEAALSGNFDCARLYFSDAIDAVRPADGSSVPEDRLAFSFELWEGIQRYEALAGATEEAGTSHGQISPELEAIETPETTPEEISAARDEVATAPSVASDVPIVVNDSVLRIIAVFQGPALHDKIAAGLSRSGRYVPMIERVFAEEGLPQDLAWIAFIESSFLPHARSPRSAQGIWQFMPRTGRQYGLKSNGIVDERSDPEKATRAAARYLSYLHELFGDWYLVMAAYNAGEGKILKAMERTGARDFWQLAATSSIRRQTQTYVPAFLASVLISKDPSHYGFEVALEPPIEFETVRLDRPVDLRTLAQGTDLSYEDLQALNPELRTPVTPRELDGYDLRVPSGSGEAVLVAFAAAPTAVPPSFKTHTAKKGDTLPRIARRYGVTVSALASANSLNPRAKVSKGQEIMVPVKVAAAPRPSKGKGSGTKKASTKTADAAEAKSYRVKSGDTLYRIALRHGVTVAEILAINGLGGVPSLKAGDRISIPAKGK
ncbi:MAG TPA: LysM peptidoglycan-binding domain-containing protein [Thermoanaerobaculia bacterium]|nr:LysM peptidoglycan-binding domain-containing protein [Thermoanaerobaculia bacterium]